MTTQQPAPSAAAIGAAQVMLDNTHSLFVSLVMEIAERTGQPPTVVAKDPATRDMLADLLLAGFERVAERTGGSMAELVRAYEQLAQAAEPGRCA
jgi:hypothetical protein